VSRIPIERSQARWHLTGQPGGIGQRLDFVGRHRTREAIRFSSAPEVDQDDVSCAPNLAEVAIGRVRKVSRTLSRTAGEHHKGIRGLGPSQRRQHCEVDFYGSATGSEAAFRDLNRAAPDLFGKFGHVTSMQSQP
jgi:hypothetical protein